MLHLDNSQYLLDTILEVPASVAGQSTTRFQISYTAKLVFSEFDRGGRTLSPFQIAYLYVPDNEPGCTVKTVVIRPQIEVLTFRRLYITCSHKLTNAFLVLSGATPYHAIVRRPPS